MAAFPRLNTGAVAQYPIVQITSQSSRAIRFLDGSDQRFLTQGRPLRSWQIHLRLLNESEMAGIEAFFAAQLGEYSKFTFTDPQTGTAIPNCRFGEDSLKTYLDDVDRNDASLWVVETYG